MIFGQPLIWRETHKPARFLVFEGRVVLVLILAVLHIRIWTLLLALAVMLVLYYFDRRGVSADSILRYCRSAMVGKKRSARGRHRERPSVNFHFEAVRFKEQMDQMAAIEAGEEQQAGVFSRLLTELGIGKSKGTSRSSSGE